MTTAEAHFRRTVELQPDNPAARNHLGVLLSRSGRTEEAIEQWRASLAARSDH